MDSKNITLNDFEAFDRFIFGDRKHNWKKLYNKETDTFYPPIPIPETEVEHQLDHYALWMTMGNYYLTKKPARYRHLFSGRVTLPNYGCYACGYAYIKKNNPHINCLTDCPLTSISPSSCADIWKIWCSQISCAYRTPSKKYILSISEQIARIPWREIQ